MTAPGAVSASGFLRKLRDGARARRRTVVFAEGTEARVHEALADALPDALFDAVLVGPAREVRAGLELAGVDPAEVSVVDPEDPEQRAWSTELLRSVRSERGRSVEGVAELVSDPLVQSALMVRSGRADGGVAGAVRTTADVVRNALGVVGLAAGRRTVSSSFFMVFDEAHARGPAVLTFTDAGVVPDPGAPELAEIAAAAAAAHRAVVGEPPRVAFLSYSTKGSAEGVSVTRAREALALFRAAVPDVPADGELQADAALIGDVAARKAPGSDVAGRANVLVFPDLASANIAYKLVQHLGGAHALGPVLQGLAKPFNDLSRGATASDIVAVSCITALMAE